MAFMNKIYFLNKKLYFLFTNYKYINHKIKYLYLFIYLLIL